jgi:hypothetical protein
VALDESMRLSAFDCSLRLRNNVSKTRHKTTRQDHKTATRQTARQPQDNHKTATRLPQEPAARQPRHKTTTSQDSHKTRQPEDKITTKNKTRQDNDKTITFARQPTSQDDHLTRQPRHKTTTSQDNHNTYHIT